MWALPHWEANRMKDPPGCEWYHNQKHHNDTLTSERCNLTWGKMEKAHIETLAGSGRTWPIQSHTFEGMGFTGSSRMYLPNQDPSEQNFDPRWLWCTHLHPHAHCIAEPTAGQLAHLVGHLVNITPNIDEFHTHSMERERVEEQVSEVRTSSTRRKSLPLEMAAHPMNHGEQEHSLTCHVHIAAWHVVPTLTFVTCCAHIGIHAHHCSGFFHTGT